MELPEEKPFFKRPDFDSFSEGVFKRSAQEKHRAGVLISDSSIRIPAPEWKRLEDGLVQRAELIEWMYQDLYRGGGKMMQNKVFPSRVLYANTSYLRAACWEKRLNSHEPMLLSFDVICSRPGDWKIWDQRLQSPNGLGRILALRNTTLKGLTGESASPQTCSLAPFFQSLESLINVTDEDGLGALFVPGSRAPHYHEQMFLAQSLGLCLVDHSRLKFRDGCIGFDSLAGWRKVRRMLRFLTDDYCDPVELFSESLIGVPGLLEASRNGKLDLINPIGVGLFEGIGFYPFLKDIAEMVLGRPLGLESAPAHWLGYSHAVQEVFHGKDLYWVTQILSRNPKGLGIWYPSHGPCSHSVLDEVKHTPHEFVAIKAVDAFTASSSLSERSSKIGLFLRVFLLRTNHRWTMLPSALDLDPQQQENGVLSGFAPSNRHVLVNSTLAGEKVSAELQFYCSTTSLGPLSRIPRTAADDLFWLGRYARRVFLLVDILCFQSASLSKATGRVSSEIEHITWEVLEASLMMESKDFELLIHLGIEKAISKLAFSSEIKGGVIQIRNSLSQITDRLFEKGITPWKSLQIATWLTTVESHCVDLYRDPKPYLHSLRKGIGKELLEFQQGEWTEGASTLIDLGQQVECLQNQCSLLNQYVGSSNRGIAWKNFVLHLLSAGAPTEVANDSSTGLMRHLLLDPNNKESFMQKIGTLRRRVNQLPQSLVCDALLLQDLIYSCHQELKKAENALGKNTQLMDLHHCLGMQISILRKLSATITRGLTQVST